MQEIMRIILAGVQPIIFSKNIPQKNFFFTHSHAEDDSSHAEDVHELETQARDLHVAEELVENLRQLRVPWRQALPE